MSGKEAFLKASLPLRGHHVQGAGVYQHQYKTHNHALPRHRQPFFSSPIAWPGVFEGFCYGIKMLRR